MSTLKITAQTRDGSGKGAARKLRQAGRIPAILYSKGREGVSLTLDNYEITNLLASERARTSVLELEFTEGKKSVSRNILIKEIQKHPYRDEILHMDLLEVAMDKKISVMVPIETVGTAQGVTMGGILEMKRRQLEVVCLPDRIPESIVIDITDLDIGDAVHVESIQPPEGVEIPHDVNFTLMTLVGASVEPEPEELEEEEELAEEVEGEEAPEEEEGEEEAEKE